MMSSQTRLATNHGYLKLQSFVVSNSNSNTNSSNNNNSTIASINSTDHYDFSHLTNSNATTNDNFYLLSPTSTIINNAANATFDSNGDETFVPCTKMPPNGNSIPGMQEVFHKFSSRPHPSPILAATLHKYGHNHHPILGLDVGHCTNPSSVDDNETTTLPSNGALLRTYYTDDRLIDESTKMCSPFGGASVKTPSEPASNANFIDFVDFPPSPISSAFATFESSLGYGSFNMDCHSVTTSPLPGGNSHFFVQGRDQTDGAHKSDGVNDDTDCLFGDQSNGHVNGLESNDRSRQAVDNGAVNDDDDDDLVPNELIQFVSESTRQIPDDMVAAGDADIEDLDHEARLASLCIPMLNSHDDAGGDDTYDCVGVTDSHRPVHRQMCSSTFDDMLTSTNGDIQMQLDSSCYSLSSPVSMPSSSTQLLSPHMVLTHQHQHHHYSSSSPSQHMTNHPSVTGEMCSTDLLYSDQDLYNGTSSSSTPMDSQSSPIVRHNHQFIVTNYPKMSNFTCVLKNESNIPVMASTTPSSSTSSTSSSSLATTTVATTSAPTSNVGERSSQSSPIKIPTIMNLLCINPNSVLDDGDRLVTTRPDDSVDHSQSQFIQSQNTVSAACPSMVHVLNGDSNLTLNQFNYSPIHQPTVSTINFASNKGTYRFVTTPTNPSNTSLSISLDPSSSSSPSSSSPSTNVQFGIQNFNRSDLFSQSTIHSSSVAAAVASSITATSPNPLRPLNHSTPIKSVKQLVLSTSPPFTDHRTSVSSHFISPSPIANVNHFSNGTSPLVRLYNGQQDDSKDAPSRLTSCLLAVADSTTTTSTTTTTTPSPNNNTFVNARPSLVVSSLTPTAMVSSNAVASSNVVNSSNCFVLPLQLFHSLPALKPGVSILLNLKNSNVMRPVNINSTTSSATVEPLATSESVIYLPNAATGGPSTVPVIQSIQPQPTINVIQPTVPNIMAAPLNVNSNVYGTGAAPTDMSSFIVPNESKLSVNGHNLVSLNCGRSVGSNNGPTQLVILQPKSNFIMPTQTPSHQHTSSINSSSLDHTSISNFTLFVTNPVAKTPTNFVLNNLESIIQPVPLTLLPPVAPQTVLLSSSSWPTLNPSNMMVNSHQQTFVAHSTLSSSSTMSSSSCLSFDTHSLPSPPDKSNHSSVTSTGTGSTAASGSFANPIVIPILPSLTTSTTSTTSSLTVKDHHQSDVILSSELRKNVIVLPSADKLLSTPPRSYPATSAPTSNRTSNIKCRRLSCSTICTNSATSSSNISRLCQAISPLTLSTSADTGNHSTTPALTSMNSSLATTASVSSRRRHQCPYCPKSCERKDNLQAHIRTHTGERPYPCRFCPKAFPQKDHLRAHIRTHTGEKPYRCPQCLKAFAQLGNLHRHVKTHRR